MKMKLLLCTSILVLSGSTLFAQKTIEGHFGKKGYDIAYAAAATSDGGFIITGLTKSTDTSGNIVVIKLSAHGDTLWTKEYGGPLLEGGNSVMQTSDSEYLITGHTEDFGSQDCDAFLMKMDKEGNIKWFRHYGGAMDDISEGAIELPGGGYVIAGITASYGNPTPSTVRHAWFVKLNPDGTIAWKKCYAGKGAEYAYSIASVSSGGYLGVGWTTSWGDGEKDGWLLRLNDNGDTISTRLYKYPGETIFYKILPTMDNGYILAGYTTPSKTSKHVGLAVKLDANGNELWRKTYGDPAKGLMFHDVAQLPDGNLMFVGTNYSIDTNGAIYTLTTDADGKKITDNMCGGNQSYGSCIAIQGNNSYLVAGIAIKYGDPNGDLYYYEDDRTISGVNTVNKISPTVYPNPFTGKTSIVLPAPYAYQSVNIDVTNMSGQLVYSRKNVPGKNIVIDHNNRATGQYIFRIYCNDGNIFKGKITAE